VEVTYILELDLEDEGHSVWDLWTSNLHECKGNGSFEVGRAVISFWSGLENLDLYLDGWLCVILPPPKSTPGEGGGRVTFPINTLLAPAGAGHQ